MVQLLKMLKNEVFQLVVAILAITGGTIVFIRAYVPHGTEVTAERHVSEPISLPDGKKVSEYALSLQGKKYRHGAKGPNYFDCSGFTDYVFSQFAISLPASAEQQSRHGSKLSVEEVRKGDLLFFKGTSNKEDADAGHVGIVTSSLGGKIEFIHSSIHGGVIVDSLSHRYYAARYIGARRVLNN